MDKLLPNERFVVTDNWRPDKLEYDKYRFNYPVIGQKGTIVRYFRVGEIIENNEYAVEWDSPNVETRGDGDLVRLWMIKRISVRMGDRVKQIGSHDGLYSPYCIILSIDHNGGDEVRIRHRHDGQFKSRWLETSWEDMENKFELIDNFNIFVKGNIIKSKLTGEKGMITRVIDNNVYANWEKDKFLEFYLNKEDIEVIGVNNEA